MSAQGWPKRGKLAVNRWSGEDEESRDEYDNYAEEDEEEPEEELTDEWELDPNDPEHPDFDLSEAAGEWSWQPQKSAVVLRRGFVFFVSLLLVIVLIIPLFLRLMG